MRARHPVGPQAGTDGHRCVTSGGRIRTRCSSAVTIAPLLELSTVAMESRGTHRALILRAQVHEPHDSSMRTSIQDRQLAEVLVERDQYPSLRGGRRQYLFIPRICRPVADPLDIVTRGAQDRGGPAPHTGVEQNLHDLEDSTSAGSMRSCPTRRLAYARHARMSSGSRPGVALQHDLRRIAGGQHAEDMLDGQTTVPDDRLAAEDGRVRRDSTQKVRFAASAVHDSHLPNHATSVPTSGSPRR